jgi:hypothetical protein
MGEAVSAQQSPSVFKAGALAGPAVLSSFTENETLESTKDVIYHTNSGKVECSPSHSTSVKSLSLSKHQLNGLIVRFNPLQQVWKAHRVS